MFLAILAILIGSVLASLALLLLGALARVAPGTPAVAVGIALLVVWVGVRAVRSASRTRAPERPEQAEDVGELDVYFVCGECGTEFRVEKIGELQVPRHCGERMAVERRARQSPPALN